MLQSVIEGYYSRRQLRAFYQIDDVRQMADHLGRLLYPAANSATLYTHLGRLLVAGFWSSSSGLRWQTFAVLNNREQSFADLVRYARLVPGTTARIKQLGSGHCLLLVNAWPLPPELLAVRVAVALAGTRVWVAVRVLLACLVGVTVGPEPPQL